MGLPSFAVVLQYYIHGCCCCAAGSEALMQCPASMIAVLFAGPILSALTLIVVIQSREIDM